MKPATTNSSPASCSRALQKFSAGEPLPWLNQPKAAVPPRTSHLPPGHGIETLLPRRLLLPVRVGDPAVRYTAIIFAPPAGLPAWARIRCARTRFCRTFALWVGHPFLGPGRRRDLPLALVKVESRIQFGLAAQQFLKSHLVLVRPARLFLKIPQHLFSAVRAVPLLRHGLVQSAQRVFDALHGPDGILRVQLRLVDARSPDEQLRQPLVVRTGEERRPPSPAQNLKAAERAPHLQRQIVPPRQHGLRERRRSFLARALAGINPFADAQGELFSAVSVAVCNID